MGVIQTGTRLYIGGRRGQLVIDTQHLLCGRDHGWKCFTYIVLLNFHNNPVGKMLLPLFHRLGSRE